MLVRRVWIWILYIVLYTILLYNAPPNCIIYYIPTHKIKNIIRFYTLKYSHGYKIHSLPYYHLCVYMKIQRSRSYNILDENNCHPEWSISKTIT